MILFTILIFFENSKNNGVNELEKIIEIKERLIKENPD